MQLGGACLSPSERRKWVVSDTRLYCLPVGVGVLASVKTACVPASRLVLEGMDFCGGWTH